MSDDLIARTQRYAVSMWLLGFVVGFCACVVVT